MTLNIQNTPLSTALRGAFEVKDTKFGVLSYATGPIGSRGVAQDPEFWAQTRMDSAAGQLPHRHPLFSDVTHC